MECKGKKIIKHKARLNDHVRHDGVVYMVTGLPYYSNHIRVTDGIDYLDIQEGEYKVVNADWEVFKNRFDKLTWVSMFISCSILIVYPLYLALKTNTR